MGLLRLVTVCVLSFGLLILGTGSIYSQEDSLETVEVNSFELFWPMAAGRTLDDPVYPLKRLKETLRGWLIFGKTQKADYLVFLSAKRVLEAEKLYKEGKPDLADKTLDLALENLEKANNIGEVGADSSELLGKIEKLASWLSSKEAVNKEKLTDVVTKTMQLVESSKE